ncbi:hypothetical protein SKAU_G00124340 [Synaphobranchus kaupii]|uniref:SPIN-DOC-like zinc-finger domain-containing protein n=1 Tax=Synaphobranchus kaupii TaxID=118154 RepID=A0A9Q1J2Q8_SYNKA|nr:hypothetical protein SKAU_G00124340 [Synaphobranchus kaupii]
MEFDLNHVEEFNLHLVGFYLRLFFILVASLILECRVGPIIALARTQCAPPHLSGLLALLVRQNVSLHFKKKKRKFDSENRQFNNEWTEKYLFIDVSGKPVCLICNECLSVCKEYNLRRHFKTTHANFDATFPPDSTARRQKILGLTSCYEQRRRTLFRVCTEQERATSASLRVAWILAKKKKPFTDSETVKECMLASVGEVVTDEKTRRSIIDSIKQIPISDSSNMRRVEALASDVFETLLDKLRKAEVMSLAVDESTDNSDVVVWGGR